VYERFATLDALSSGRAEVILGRGSFIESFPLFGYDLATTRCSSRRSSTSSRSCSPRSP
jgi:alkanesulfonate monooxygenase SsuD/methylene tetrahydromethanopterin reductase-like flavin-dependent oxidoreductase (luciferase family)